MDQPPRKLRTLVYALGDVEKALRTGARTAGAETVSLVIKRISAIPPQEFLDESRTALEEVLLGERDLPVDTIGLLLDVLASVDDVLREFSQRPI